MKKTELIHIGTFGRPIGLKGQIKINILTSSFDFFKRMKYYVSEDYTHIWEFEEIITKNNQTIAKIKNYNNIEEVKILTGNKIFTKLNKFPKTKKNQYYVRDLIGCQVFSKNNIQIGIVINVDNFGAGDLLEVKKNNKKIYIPMNQENLVSIEIKKQKIMVDPIEGIIT